MALSSITLQVGIGRHSLQSLYWVTCICCCGCTGNINQVCFKWAQTFLGSATPDKLVWINFPPTKYYFRCQTACYLPCPQLSTTCQALLLLHLHKRFTSTGHILRLYHLCDIPWQDTVTGQAAAGTQIAATAAAGPSAGALLGDTGKTKNCFKK